MRFTDEISNVSSAVVVRTDIHGLNSLGKYFRHSLRECRDLPPRANDWSEEVLPLIRYHVIASGSTAAPANMTGSNSVDDPDDDSSQSSASTPRVGELVHLFRIQ